MAKKLTLVLRVSDDTSEMFQEWLDSATDKVMFMGTVVDVLDMKIEPCNEEAATASLLSLLDGIGDEQKYKDFIEQYGNVKFLPGSPEAAVVLGVRHWTDGQGNVHWLEQEQ